MRSRDLIPALIALAACGKGGEQYGEKDPRRWLQAKWQPVSGELKGVAFTAEVPAGLPENKEFLLGKDWWAGTNVDVEHLEDAAGPRLSLRRMDETWSTPDELAHYVEPGPRADLQVIAKEKLPDGRLRFASVVNYGSHVDVSVWIPIASGGGVDCTAHWWWGVDEHPRGAPDPALIAWLDRFCASVRL